MLQEIETYFLMFFSNTNKELNNINQLLYVCKISNILFISFFLVKQCCFSACTI